MLLKFWQTHSVFFKTFAVAFAIIFLMLAFAPPFSYDAHAVALLDDGIFMIIIAFLAACGITITASSSQSAIEWVEDAVNAFCTNASKTWETIKSGFSFGVNKLGEILTNNAVLDFLSEFVNWVRSEYGFADNTDIQLVGPSVSFGVQLPVESSPSQATVSANGFFLVTYNRADYHVASNVSDVHIFVVQPSSNTNLRFYAVSTSSFDVYLSQTQGFNTYTSSLDESYNLYSVRFHSFSVSSTTYIAPELVIYTSLDSAYGAYLDYLSAVGDASYVTAGVGTMDIPFEGTDYDDDDGAIIGGFGTLGDSLQEILRRIREWLDAQSPANTVDPTLEVAPEADIANDMDTGLLSLDNWPAIIPPLSLHDFSFNSIWHYVTDWIASFSGTLATIMGITFSLPAIPILYAVVVISLALWLLRRASS